MVVAFRESVRYFVREAGCRYQMTNLSPKITANWLFASPHSRGCGSAWKKDPGSGVIGVEKGPLIPVV
jgi:hypothetical protein